jgi:hypothetical protein
MIVRHGEKPLAPKTAPFAVLDDGTQDKHALIVRGWTRAGALVPFFSQPWLPAIQTPGTIYAAGYVQPANDAASDDGDGSDGIEDPGHSLRPSELVTPLADRLQLKLNESFAVGDETALVADLRRASGVVLVSWEHKHIPIIGAQLFAGVPAAWPGARFDIVWMFNQAADGSYAFSQIPQQLLSGDLDTVIPA